MAPQTPAPTLTVVADQEASEAAAGERIKKKRLALGMSKSALAKEAGIDRATLVRIEDGRDGVRDTTRAAVERALSDLDEEMSPPVSSEGDEKVVRFVVRGVYGADALIVEGPIENIAELEASVDRIMRGLRSEDVRDS